MKVEKQQFEALLKRLLKAEPETAATIAKPKLKKDRKSPAAKPSR
jgi:hypothetical protein